MMRVTFKSILFFSGALVLGACSDNSSAEYLPAGVGAASTELVVRDIEAPEILSLREPGQWDGNPSLGGVWATHPTVRQTQRVIIRNPANDRFVVGSFFAPNASASKEVDLQVSSDAAAALGMVAVDPTVLNVTALRQVTGDAPMPEPVSSEPAPLGVETTPLTPAPIVAVAPTASSTLTRPFIQVGTFAVRANAQGVVARLNAAGIPARIRDDTARGAAVYGVLAGPAATSAERQNILTKVKAEGFSDAYPVKG